MEENLDVTPTPDAPPTAPPAPPAPPHDGKVEFNVTKPVYLNGKRYLGMVWVSPETAKVLAHAVANNCETLGRPVWSKEKHV